jgi:phosphinothricin acetyltransferase
MNNIRLAKFEDLEAIVNIYNQAIKTKFCTGDTECITVNDREDWFSNHKPEKYPINVYIKDNKIVGWSSISPYRPGRYALRYTIEISYYIHQDFHRQGIGSELVEYTINKCKELNYKSVFGIILEKNIASIKLMQKFGFELWGLMPDVADFDGEECGHVYYGKKL